MSSETRPTLLERLREGADALAWDEFFQRYWRLIYGFAKRRGSSDQTAEEIVQDVMLTIFQKRDVYRYDRRRGRFRDWLGALARNKLVDHRRRPSERVRGSGGDATHPLAEPEADAPAADAAWEAAFEEALLLVLLDVIQREMNPRTFQAFELFVLHEIPAAEVARTTGLTPNAVYQARKNVVKKLTALGASYREEGQLNGRLKRALQSAPAGAVERSLTDRLARTMRMQ
ncbi:MAG: RNA polymerase sigma factor [Planctomycetota bacterium]|jgi:RNA polymerase sigma factor (sigma-70 family)